MYTKIVSTNAGQISIHSNGTSNNSKEYYLKAKDIVQNADGSYAIPSITDAKNADAAMAMDTGLTLLFDEEAGVWWDSFKV